MFVFSHAAKAGEVKSYSEMCESVVLRESYFIFVPSTADEHSLDALWEFIQRFFLTNLNRNWQKKVKKMQYLRALGTKTCIINVLAYGVLPAIDLL